MQRNSWKGFGCCRLSCLLYFINYRSIPLCTKTAMKLMLSSKPFSWNWIPLYVIVKISQNQEIPNGTIINIGIPNHYSFSPALVFKSSHICQLNFQIILVVQRLGIQRHLFNGVRHFPWVVCRRSWRPSRLCWCWKPQCSAQSWSLSPVALRTSKN